MATHAMKKHAHALERVRVETLAALVASVRARDLPALLAGEWPFISVTQDGQDVRFVDRKTRTLIALRRFAM